MFMRMTFHLMEIMINRDERVILSVIDSHVLVSLAIKRKLSSRFYVAEETLISYQYPALLVTCKSHAIGI